MPSTESVVEDDDIALQKSCCHAKVSLWTGMRS